MSSRASTAPRPPSRRRVIKFAIIRHVLLPLLIPVAKVWVRTWRLRGFEESVMREIAQARPGVALASLHGNAAILLAIAAQRPFGLTYRTTTLVSPSRDGRLMHDLIGAFGQRTTEGSSRSRAVGGLMALCDAVQSGLLAIVTVDGPRGPRCVPQPGIFLVARQAQTKLFVFVANARRALVFGSWDRFLLPLPFAVVDCRLELFHDYANGKPLENERALLQQHLIRILNQTGDDAADVQRLHDESSS